MCTPSQQEHTQNRADGHLDHRDGTALGIVPILEFVGDKSKRARHDSLQSVRVESMPSDNCGACCANVALIVQFAGTTLSPREVSGTFIWEPLSGEPLSVNLLSVGRS